MSPNRLVCDTLEEEGSGDDSVSTDTKTLWGHCRLVHSMRFFTDGSGLLSCSGDMSIRYWDLGSFSNNLLYQGHKYPMWDLDISQYSLYFARGVARSNVPTEDTHRTPDRRGLCQVPP